MFVEHFALGAAIHQALEFLLAVDFDQVLRQFPQCLNRYHLAVHIGSRTAVRADHPAQHDFAVAVDALRFEPGFGRLRKGVETRGDLGALGAAAHDVPAGAAAGNEQERIDDDGLTGAGFAGEGREAGFEFEFGLIDDDQIAQLQVRQHALPAP